MPYKTWYGFSQCYLLFVVGQGPDEPRVSSIMIQRSVKRALPCNAGVLYHVIFRRVLTNLTKTEQFTWRSSQNDWGLLHDGHFSCSGPFSDISTPSSQRPLSRFWLCSLKASRGLCLHNPGVLSCCQTERGRGEKSVCVMISRSGVSCF